MICGVEIKSNEAIIALADDSTGTLQFIEGKFNKIALDASDQDHYKSFLEAFSAFLKQNNVEKLFLKRPIDKGQQISGPNAFRVETLINLISIPVVSLHPITLAAFIKKTELAVTNSIKSKKYQEAALWTAFWGFTNG